MPAPATAAALPSPETAVAEAFPGAIAARATWALSDEELARVRETAGSVPEARLVGGWVLTRDGRPAGLALLESHEVRSKRETLLVSVTPDLRVIRVDVLAFSEPPEYLPGERWLQQFCGKELGPGLAVKREIRGITGATLTARAATAATRRALAVAEILARRGPQPAGPAGAAAPAQAP